MEALERRGFRAALVGADRFHLAQRRDGLPRGRQVPCLHAAPAEFGGGDMYNTWSYTRIQPYERIEFILNFADKNGTKLDPAAVGIPPGVPADVPHVVTFKALSANRTEMSVSEFGYTTAEARDLSKAGLEQCVDKMGFVGGTL